VVIEAGAAQGWERLYVSGDRPAALTPSGELPIISVERYGLSGPGKEVQKALGISVERLVALIEELAEG
jgi:transketolase